MTVKQRTWQTLCEPRYGKPVRIFFWANKEFDSLGHEIHLDGKCIRSWDNTLGHITAALNNPRFGPVRRLYHIPTKKIIRCLKDIVPNEKYLAVGIGSPKFKKNGYLTEQERMRLGHPLNASKKFGNFDPNVNIDFTKNFMNASKQKNRTVVYFSVSGRTCKLPLKVVLIESDFMSYKMILDYLSYRLDVAEGVQRIHHPNGKVISKLSELKHGGLYIAVPFGGKFVKLDYDKLSDELMKLKLEETSDSEPKLKTNKKKKQRKLVEQQTNETHAGTQLHTGFKLPKCVCEEVIDKTCKTYQDESQNTSAQRHSNDSLAGTESHTEFLLPKCVGQKCIDKTCKSHKLEFQRMSVQRQTNETLRGTDSHTGLLLPECIGQKCTIKTCKRHKHEYQSIAVIPSSEEDANASWDDSAVESAEKVTEMVEEEITIEKNLHKVVVADESEEIISNVIPDEHDEDVPPEQREPKVVAVDSLTDQLMEERMSDEGPPDEEKKEKNNLTTFADVAQNTQLQKDGEILIKASVSVILSSMSPTTLALERVDSSASQFSKKSVSFFKANAPPPIYEADEKNEALSVPPQIVHDNKKRPKASILKNKDDPSIVKEKPPPVKIQLKDSFQRARSSITLDKPLAPEILKLKGLSNDEELSDLFSVDSLILTEDEASSVKTTDKDPKASVNSIILETKEPISKGVQKNWKVGAEVLNKSIQTDDLAPLKSANNLRSSTQKRQIFATPSEIESFYKYSEDISDIYGNFDPDPGTQSRESRAGSLEKRERESLPCGREKCVTFACKDIRFGDCLENEECIKSCPRTA